MTEGAPKHYAEHHHKDEDRLDFGKSKFRGRDSLAADLERAWAQLVVLLKKNWLIVSRRVLPLLIVVLLPTAAIMIMFLGNKGIPSGGSSPLNYPSYPLAGLGPADVAHPSSAVQVAFAPDTPLYAGIMEDVAALNGLTYGTDVVGFPSNYTLKEYVARNLGEVQFSVFFIDQPLWRLGDEDPDSPPDAARISYTVFSNNSAADKDPRSGRTRVQFPLLALQKTIDHSIMRSASADPNGIVFEAEFGTLWSFSPGETASVDSLLNKTACDLENRDFGDLGDASSWVFPFVQSFVGVIAFQLVTEERSKFLFSMLRRLGLYDSVYWASWFITFLALNTVGAAVAVFFSAVLRPQLYPLRHIDLGVIFTLFLVANTCSTSMSLFLASVSNSSSANTAVVITVFITLVFTIAFCSTPLNSYSYDYYFDSDAGQYARYCALTTSSYNTIYSTNLLGNTFVEFLVFFMPWFHMAQAITDILSVVQYDGETFKFSDLQSPPQTLSYSGTESSEFDSKWVQWSYGMMLCSALIYMFLAWFFGLVVTSDISEGRSLTTIFFPPRLRQLLWHVLGDTGLMPNPRPVILEGDIRGQEKALSFDQKSIRGYKVSKTFTSVQALKEISFTMSRGEVFVILGKNGAGKSTLINIITGQYSATHGSVYVSGMDVGEDISLIQQSIGVCPQSDLLWDDLTAREHIDIHAAFKGIESGEILSRAVEIILKKVGLFDRGDSYARDFSGGMKRRLAVAMSAVGEVDAIFLDEPTTGLDPLSRHGVWDVINWLKGNKVVVLTTHNMEEADYLGDNILIMHEGKKKAFGNSLFLKENYGRGYQINLVTEQSYVPVVQTVLKSSLPGSTFIGDSSLTGYVSVNVSRRDVFNLPRFFAWLESSPGAVANIREWGISNTTLEQVFLMLCKSSTDVNFVDNREVEDSTLCPMCRVRPKEIVMVRNIPGQIFLLPEAVCAVCTVANRNYFVTEDEFTQLQLLPYPSPGFSAEIDRLLAAARDKATLEYLDQMHFAVESRPPAEPTAALAIEPAPTNAADPNETTAGAADGGESKDSETAVVSAEVQSESVEAVAGNPLEGTEQHKPAMMAQARSGLSSEGVVVPARAVSENPHALVMSTVQSQVEAVLIKNARLQSLQRCSNICGLLFVGIMFLFLYVFSLLFQFADSIAQCRGGYVTFGGEPCSQESLINHIFSGRDDNSFVPEEDGTDNKPLGFAIQQTLVPFSYSNKVFLKETEVNYIYYQYHYPVLWTDLISEASYYNGFYSASSPNYTTSAAITDSNGYMFAQQEANFEAALATAYPRCPAYAPQPDNYPGSGIYTPEEYTAPLGFTPEFAKHFASASFDCPTCGSGQGIFFDGAIWVADPSTDDSSVYRYSFLGFNGSKLDEGLDYFSESFCPANLGAISNAPEFAQVSNTANAMTYVNILSNAVYNASYIGATLPIQTGTSEYGNLFFDASFVARVVSLFLPIFAILLMNGTWPLAVWRLSYERSARIALMMKTVGMRPFAYVFGMYVFDMIVSCTFSIGAMVGAVELNLSRFKDAPLAYLVLTAVLSAHAVNGLAILLVQLYSKRSTLMSLLAAVFSIASTIGSLLLIVIKYPNDGDWPNGLSLIPFFAQSRCVYILLVTHEATDEVNLALTLMFIVGVVCIALSLLLEYEITIPFLLEYTGISRSFAAAAVEAPRSSPSEGGVEMTATARTNDEGLSEQPAAAAQSMCCLCQRSEYSVIPARHRHDEADDAISGELVDADVVRENEMMRALTQPHAADHTVDPPAVIHDSAVAIGISQVRYTYPPSLNGTPGTKALKGVSLKIEYGECFGLLGPNGSGKTTLISALSGHIAPKNGSAIYIAGQNILQSADIIHSMVGVCPQEDIVWSELNVQQHLAFQAKQRGIPSPQISAEVQRVALLVNLDGDALLTPAAKLSGGMKRRLSIGMSIVGDPPILYLDECTAGLDPENKHQIWRIVQKLKNPHRCILFSSHSMDEVETLSTRIAILVKGRLQCVGSSMHLKKKYGEGYTITVNTLKKDKASSGVVDVENPEQTDVPLTATEAEVTAVTDAQDSGGDLLDDFIIKEVAREKGFLIAVLNNTRKYRIDKDTRTISDIFMLMESNKAKFAIREWGISMATLEEVFISAVERATENETKK